MLDKAATFCMHAFNPRILTEYVHLRGPLGLPPSRQLSQALKLRLLQILHELDFADIAARLPPLLPGEAGQEVLGAACRQVCSATLCLWSAGSVQKQRVCPASGSALSCAASLMLP